MPGAAAGMRAEDPTIAELLKPHGYATGQFGKNHLGDRDEHLPTMHGFDEFFGNLYHLNAEEEPELRDYPTEKDFPNFRKNFGPRGVLHCWADGKGGQKIENTGPLTKKRMETIDDETGTAARDFIDRAHKDGKPFFVWYNTTHMHFRTHAKPESMGQSGRWQSEYHDAMIDHDKNVGEMLAKLDELGIAEDTIVFYSTDNGPHMNSWPDAGMTPFRSEKNTNWEGAFRVPGMVRWPGKIKAGSVSNQMISHMDWLPTILAAAGEPDIKEKLLKGHKAGDKTFKVHLDGYNQLPYLTGETDKARARSSSTSRTMATCSACGTTTGRWFSRSSAAQGTCQTLGGAVRAVAACRISTICGRTRSSLRTITSNTYWDWIFDHAYLLVPAQQIVGQFLATFKDYPPRQKAASFSLDQVLEKLQEGIGSR